MMPCGEFLGRKWNLQDVVIATVLSSMHFLCLFAPFYFTWGAFWLAFGLHMLTGLGVTLSFHRNLAHKSFRLPKWLEYLFAYIAVLSLQGVRIVSVLHGTLLVNSAGHMWGKQAYNTGDLSRNNWWLAMVALGEGWHNNHHAFDYSARQGLEWWQIDLTWYVIKILQAIGWATDVKTPTESQKQRKVFNGEMVATDAKARSN
ncbi:palmitoyl-monogalactosyldiacylglycerol delta-7 desaturase [Pyrus ussuriensis x Pyrus communis]|uniref:Palmitoyl-monogalactosyldiacylglycerol delta-7 desaturase n=1 Tax=Pyrus ussuriensis x Pyrus communis TaxID=2448454 RepID=A0A5N5GU03_9ROSA|nr:palmitoyl-monogalactosyldiacylglycerol delta-7 desaturase [Pyrus ussuriensis x Pyrus communis]